MENLENIEMVLCPYCGKETPGNQTICQHCGGEFTFEESDGYSEELEEVKDRNGFVSFYLWLCLIVNSILCFISFLTMFLPYGMYSAFDPMWLRIAGTILSGCTAVSFWMLLKYKKSGFRLLTVTAILTFLININVAMVNGPKDLAPLILLALVYAVLQIRKDGKSCWSQLS